MVEKVGDCDILKSKIWAYEKIGLFMPISCVLELNQTSGPPNSRKQTSLKIIVEQGLDEEA